MNKLKRILVVLISCFMILGTWGTSASEKGADSSKLFTVVQADDTDDPLKTTKTVEPNGDGTYKITLSVTGAVEESSHTETSSANVIVVLDVSTSMNESLSGSITRLDAVKTAANVLVEAMPNAAKVEMALISFGGSVSTVQSWLTIESDDNKATLKSKINALTTNKGTNWTDALTTAKTLADNKKSSGDTDPTYIIFLTDGCPTTNKNGHNHGGSGTTDTNDTCISDPLSTMTEMVAAGYKVYGIYANTTSSSTRPISGNTYTGDTDPLAYVIRLSGAEGYYNADSTDALNDTFTALATTITESLGYSGVSVDDGITEMTAVSASASISGEASGFEYKKNGENWDGAPEAVVDENGNVVWDLSSLNNLEKDVTYSVSFDVWPSQDAYDLIADLNNGLYPISSKSDDVKSQLAVTVGSDEYVFVTGSGWSKDAETYISTDDLEDLIESADSASYKLLTNTHLITNYTHNNENFTINKDKGNGGIALATTTIDVKKTWANALDGRLGDEIYVYLKCDEDFVKKDGVNWEIPLSYNSETNESTAEDIYISYGFMTLSGEGNIKTIDVKETTPGHDYTIAEKPSETYYWELTSDIYHPMVINGTPTALKLVTDTDNAPELEDNTTDGTYYKFDNKLYVAESGENVLTAQNDRRSYLNLTKAVDGEGAPEDTLFTYTVTINNPNGKHPGDAGYDAENTDGYWFSLFDPTIPVLDENGNPALDDQGNPKFGATVTPENTDDFDTLVEGATAEVDDSGKTTGYFYADNGGTATIKIKAGWNIRFINLVTNTTYSIEESSEMDPGFVFGSASATANGVELDGVVSAMKAEGTIETANTDYTVTYTNEYLGFFYVYHSSNNTVERIYMTDDRINEEGKFNIYKETFDETLYGGYYSAYAGQKKAAAELDYDDNWAEDTGATPYTGDKTTWKSGDAISEEPGTSMTPVKNITYYLKEVPTWYLRPYTHYTYYKSNKKINNVWFMSDIDDKNYSSFGYEITDPSAINQKADKAVTSLKITNNGGSVTLKAKALFSQYGLNTDAWLAYYRDSLNGKYFKTGHTLEVRQYWVTPDGITEFGNTTRTITVNDGIVGKVGFSDEVSSITRK